MGELKLAITAVEAVIGVAIVMVAGDYLGYKLGRMRLFTYVIGATMVAIIAFAIYAAVVLA